MARVALPQGKQQIKSVVEEQAQDRSEMPFSTSFHIPQKRYTGRRVGRVPAEAGHISKSDPHVVLWPPNAEDEGNWPGRPQGLPPAFGFYVYFPSLYVVESIKNRSLYFS